jgi:metallo-beta-lactamase family protein
MKITLHGAAGEVTGSAYLVETDRARVLIDLGMFQGGSEQDAKNVLPSGLLATHLDAVLLTHAHLDHCGRLPLLVKAGYQGEIYATGAARELAGLILRDSAKVQSYEIERRNRKRAALRIFRRGMWMRDTCLAPPASNSPSRKRTKRLL